MLSKPETVASTSSVKLPGNRLQRFILRVLTGVDLETADFSRQFADMQAISDAAAEVSRKSQEIGEMIRAMRKDLDVALHTPRQTAHI